MEWKLYLLQVKKCVCIIHRNEVFQSCYLSLHFVPSDEGRELRREAEVGVWDGERGKQSYSLKHDSLEA